MRQEEFLNSFREALIGKVPDNVIQDNLNYYRNYIAARSTAADGKKTYWAALAIQDFWRRQLKRAINLLWEKNGKAIIRTIIQVRTGIRMMIRNRRLVIIRRLICPGGC